LEVFLREIPLHDPDRIPADWAGTLNQTEVAVLFSHAKSGVPVTPRGEPISRGMKVNCLVFDALPEAEAYCRDLCDGSVGVRCDIFDRRGKSVPPLLTIVNRRHAAIRQDKRKKIRWMMIAAGCLMSVSFPLCIWDFYRDWALILPTFLGINCFVISLRLFHWARMELEAVRERETAAESSGSAPRA
jgi:hypothetical protein